MIWWCPTHPATSIGEAYGPVRIKIPQLKMTGVPDDAIAIAEQAGVEKGVIVPWWGWMTIAIGVVAVTISTYIYRRRQPNLTPAAPTVCAQL